MEEASRAEGLGVADKVRPQLYEAYGLGLRGQDSASPSSDGMFS